MSFLVELPQNEYNIVFPLWLKAQFVNVPTDQALPVTTVMNVALMQKVVTKKWWNENSSDYLNKQNIGGIWMCRPK